MKRHLLRSIAVLSVAAFPVTACAEDPSVSKLEKASIDEIVWGQHWGGPEVKGAKSLEGKVVLLKIWGG